MDLAITIQCLQYNTMICIQYTYILCIIQFDRPRLSKNMPLQKWHCKFLWLGTWFSIPSFVVVDVYLFVTTSILAFLPLRNGWILKSSAFYKYLPNLKALEIPYSTNKGTAPMLWSFVRFGYSSHRWNEDSIRGQ